MKKYSIKNQIIFRAIIAITFILSVAFFLAQLTIVNWLNEEFDSRLLDKANVLTTLTQELEEGVEFDFADEFMPEFESETDPQYFQIWLHGGGNFYDGDGSNFERSRSLIDNNLPRQLTNTPGVLFSDTILPDQTTGRLVQSTFLPQIPEQEWRTPERLKNQSLVTVVVAMNKEPLLMLIAMVRLYMTIGVFFLTAIIGVIISKTITKGFGPINQIRAQLAQMNDIKFDGRLSLADIPQEMDLIIHQINNLLDRMEVGLQREKMFSANAAHELKTPISELFSMSEVEKKWPSKAPDNTEYCDNVLAICGEMSNTVESLLLLARADSDNIMLHPEKIDLAHWLAELIQRVAQHSTSEPAFDITLPETALIEISCDELQIVVSNILSNAIDYNEDNHPISIILNYTSEENYFIQVSNKTWVLEKNDLNLMYDRLWRKDKARQSGEHSGLGLSLVKSYAELLNLSISTVLDANQVFTLTLSRNAHS